MTHSLPHIFRRLSAALLFTTALGATAFAQALPDIAPETIAQDVERRYDQRTGEVEYVAQSFDPFENDEALAGSAALRSAGNAVTIDGDIISGGAFLDISAIYTTGSADPYDVRGYEDAEFASGQPVGVVRYDNKNLDCSRDVREVTYDDGYYTGASYGYIAGIYRLFPRYRGHRHYGWRRGYGGHRGYGHWRRRGPHGYGHGDVRRRRPHDGDVRRRRPHDGGVDRPRRRPGDGDVRRRRPHDGSVDRPRRRPGSGDGDVRRRPGRGDGDVSRRRPRDGTVDRPRRRPGSGNGDVWRRPTDGDGDVRRRRPRDGSVDRPRRRPGNGDGTRRPARDGDDSVTRRRPRTPDVDRPRRRPNVDRPDRRRVDRKPTSKDQTLVYRRPPGIRDATGNPHRKTKRPKRRDATPVSRPRRDEVRRERARNSVPNKARNNNWTRPKVQTPPKRVSKPVSRPPVSRPKASKPKAAPKPVSRPRVDRNADRTFKSNRPRVNRHKHRNFYPAAGQYSRTDVYVNARCVKEETLTLHIPQDRLDAARFDGFAVILLDREGRETPVFVPPNYVEGFRKAVGRQSQSSVTYSRGKPSVPSSTRDPIIYGDPTPKPRSEYPQ